MFDLNCKLCFCIELTYFKFVCVCGGGGGGGDTGAHPDGYDMNEVCLFVCFVS